uniref:Uncharacterized protein n=1 Tax=Aegilops tauschii subsp. strangulata TaxID=200361 RepID=A0A453RMG4_AEGTS
IIGVIVTQILRQQKYSRACLSKKPEPRPVTKRRRGKRDAGAHGAVGLRGGAAAPPGPQDQLQG